MERAREHYIHSRFQIFRGFIRSYSIAQHSYGGHVCGKIFLALDSRPTDSIWLLIESGKDLESGTVDLKTGLPSDTCRKILHAAPRLSGVGLTLIQSSAAST